jgi:uncharacterized protein
MNDPRDHGPATTAPSFIPLAALDAPSEGDVRTALAGAGAALERFAAGLSDQERAALSALLGLAAGDGPFMALAAEPAGRILSERDRAAYERLAAEPAPEATTRPLPATLVVIMKATRLCNLRCTYCHFWREGPNQIMSFGVLARTIRDALRAPGVRHVEFVWHGGEVTLLPVSFYRTAIWLQEQFRRPDQTVANAVQTNGTRLSDEWLTFLRRYDVSVGVSLDGPPEIHDSRRVDASGRPTSHKVREGIDRLRAAGIGHGVLLVVDDAIIAAGAARVLDYLLELGVPSVGLLNVIPENAPSETATGDYLPWPRYVEFLRELFRLWWPAHRDRLVIRELADLAGLLRQQPHQTCFFAGDCFGRYLTVEPTGELSACDKYIADPGFVFGTVLKGDLAGLGGAPYLATVRAENAAAVERMRPCRWFNVCNGGCPHDRRLNERYLAGFDGGCCGLAPLLEEMDAALAVPAGEVAAG